MTTSWMCQTAAFIATLSLYGGSPPAKPLTIAVVGDSISKVQVLPDSAVPCGNPMPACDYSTDGSKSYPALIGAQTGATIVNLAQPSSITVGKNFSDGEWVPGVLEMVAKIPKASDVVLWESGTNDVVAGAAPLDRIDAVASAIKSRMPHARVIVIGVRYFWGCCSARAVDAWDAREMAVCAANGWAFIETRYAWPPRVSAAWPDGTHPGRSAVIALARMVEMKL